ncbi:MAG TPA: hypothetical protein DCS42_00680 [Nitrospiraceae bacterium]|nr:hypothetical protein [Nitrospiraceae bacterium]
MLQVTNIEKNYGKQMLFDGVSFTINPRERVGLVGRNGHGKSTLFRMILGEERQDCGTITVPSGYTIGHLSQHIHFTEDTILKEACLALPTNDDYLDETYKAEAILHGLGFTNDDFDRSPSSLSGGYQVRLNLAKVLVSEPNLLLLDEPTNHLDMESIDSLVEAIEVFDGAVVIVTHSEMILNAVATKLIVYDNETVSVFDGTYQEFLERVGWNDEGGVRVKKTKKQDVDKSMSGKDRKQARREKALERAMA